MKKNRFAVACLLLVSFTFYYANMNAQNGDSLLRDATLQNVIQYALTSQPLVRQSVIDEKITELQIKSKLADWYTELPPIILVCTWNLVKLGVDNTSALQLHSLYLTATFY